MANYTQPEREQAARVLEERLEVIEDNTAYNQYSKKQYKEYYREEAALRTAIACLRSPIASPDVDGKAGGWVRTAERVPTEEDAPTGMVVNAWSYAPMCGEYGFMVMPVKDVLNLGNPNDYWISVPALPALPEVEG